MSKLSKERSLNPIQASVHLIIPFYIHDSVKFRIRMLKSDEWDSVPLDTRFYLRYIDTIFCSEKNNPGENPLTSRCLVMQNSSLRATFTVRQREVHVEDARLFCFDTSIGLVDLCVAFSCKNAEEVVDVCAGLRHTDQEYFTQFIDANAGDCPATAMTTINGVVDLLLSSIGRYTLYDHLAPNGAPRAELLASVVLEKGSVENLDLFMYRIADGIDMRSEIYETNCFLYSPLPHIRWTVTGKGACTVGILTEHPSNRSFVQTQWAEIVGLRHILWYTLVLHQKYAICHYLNEIAQKEKPSNLRNIQQKIMVFNTKYRYEMVAEEPSYQIPYEKAREVKSVEQIFADVDEEVQRIHTYHDDVREKNTGVAMTIISLVCAISTFIDIFSLSRLEQPLFEFVHSLSAPQIALYAITICATAVAMIYLVIVPLIRRIAKWLKKSACRFIRWILLCKSK